MSFSRHSKRRNASLPSLLSLCVVLCTLTVRGADRIWDGQGDGYWANAVNWSNNVAPVAGDNLLFPSGTLVPTSTTNNFAAGTAFGKISISSISFQGYVLAGNRITLNGGIAYTANQFAYAPSIYCDLTLGADQLFTSTRGVTIAGRVDLNNHFLTVAPTNTGNYFFSGIVTNSAAPYASVSKTNSGTLVIPAGARFQVAHYFNTQQGYDWASLYILNGTLRLDGVATNGNTVNPVKLRVWGPGVITGTGTADIIEVQYGGILSPGVNGPGVIRCGNIVPEASGVLQLDINGTTPGTDYDQVVTGGYPGWGGVLDLRFGYSPQVGDTFFVMVPSSPIGNEFTPSGILDHTNGCSFGLATSSNGLSVATLRTTNSPFSLWKGSVGGSFPFINYSTILSPTNNWGGGVGPSPGARLVFNEYGLNLLPLTNDLAEGYSLASLTFKGTNIYNGPYMLYGNVLTVTEGITNRTSVGTNSILLDLIVAGSMAFDIDTGSTMVFSKSFNGGGTVRKLGGGNLTYTGTTMNSYVGDFALDNGVLRVDGALTDGSITVTGGMLSGTGHVASVTMTGGIINPGSSPGIFNIDGNLNAGAGAVCRFKLNSPIAGTGYDQLRINGTVSLSGATLDIVPGYAITVGSVFLLVINDNSDAVTGTFAGLPQGAVFQAGGQWFSISYQSGSGANDIVLTRVNTPAQPGQFSRVNVLNPQTVQLQGIGGSNINYIIQANTNLNTTNWIDIGTVPTDALGHFFFNDTNVGAFPQRFFRTKSP